VWILVGRRVNNSGLRKMNTDMNTDLLQKRSGRKRKKPLKIADEIASEDGHVAPSPQPQIVPPDGGEVVKKKRGRKPGQGEEYFFIDNFVL
jgi:hypothetical protein